MELKWKDKEKVGFTCKKCGSSVHYDIECHTLKCVNCGERYLLDEYDGKSNLVINSCSSCGGEIVTEENELTAATICPYCGSPVMIKSAFDGVFKPDGILPFKITKEMVMEAYRKQYEGKLLIPNDFVQERKVESIQGLYVPFWFHDFEVTGDAKVSIKDSGSGLYHYVARFEKVPVDGSVKIADELMESIEPFTLLGEQKEFHAGYLSGFSSDRYDVDETSGRVNVVDRINKTIKMLFRSRVKDCNGVVLDNNTQHQYDKHGFQLILCPVWIVSTKYKNEEIYQFVMNGQTGIHAGNFPIDKKKSRVWIAVNILFWGMISFLFALFR